jgi:hypothetical protein
MKWKAQKKKVSKVASNPAKYLQVSDYILMQVDRFHYQWTEKSIGKDQR